MPEQLRVAVIGAGQMGAFHAETYERLPAAELVALADPDEAAARAVIGRRPVAWDADWRNTLERAEVEAVVVAAPSELHCEIGLGALDAGKHVLVEKPIATTLPDALRMASAARAAQRKLMVGHVERFNPAVAKVRELISEGRLGRVYRAHSERVGPLPMRIKDSGVAIDLATHDVDIMQHVLERDITRVYAEGTSFAHPSHEDILSCLLRFGDDGPYGLLDVNWLTPEKRRQLTLIGEGGLLRAHYITQDVQLMESASAMTGWKELALARGDAEGAAVRFALPKVEPLKAEASAFVACVLDDLPEPVNAYDGARALAGALAIRESVAGKRPIELLGMPAAPAPVS
jgi:UDP-N-acetylglucosamine 3-dehydrogenase